MGGQTIILIVCVCVCGTKNLYGKSNHNLDIVCVEPNNSMPTVQHLLKVNDPTLTVQAMYKLYSTSPIQAQVRISPAQIFVSLNC